MMKRTLRYALTIGRRVILLAGISGLILAILLWWMAPDINRLRPDIEHYLTDQMQLQNLEIGKLSWYWAWNIGIRSEHCSFSDRSGLLRVQDARVAVQISPWELLFGKVSPYRIHVGQGRLILDLDRLDAERRLILPGRLLMEKMAIDWRYAGHQGELTNFNADFDGQARRLAAHVPGARLQFRWDSSLLPEMMRFSFTDTHWLPAEWRGYLGGVTDGDMRLTRRGNRRWRLESDLQGEDATWAIPSWSFVLPFDAMHGAAVLHLQRDLTPARIEITSLRWSHGGDSAVVSGDWHEGVLALSGTSGHLSMPLLWSWLRGLGDEEWGRWLGRMQEGSAGDIKAGLHLPWKRPWAALPADEELDRTHYRVSAHVEGADIAPGLADLPIQKVSGEVELDEKGLRAEVAHAEMPYGVGSGHASVRMPWDSGVLDVEGEGESDAGKLHQWLDPDGAARIQWGKAPAHVQFALQWQPEEPSPRKAEVRLTPAPTWSIAPNQVPVDIDGGILTWRFGKGIEVADMVVHGQLLKGELSLHASRSGDQQWQLDKLGLDVHGEFSRTVRHFHLPVSEPKGSYSLRFDYQGSWQGHLDLSQAGWKNLLGMAKGVGKPMDIRSQGKFDVRQGHLDIEQLSGESEGFRLEGAGELGASGLKASLQRLRTPAFDGAIDVKAPFGDDPWELDVNARRLTRQALPQKMPESEALQGKPWSLRAKIGRFGWDDAEMRDVEINLASRTNSVGMFKAAAADIGAVEVQDVSAMFALPGGGRIDLRHFAASMGAQKVVLSAMLTPKPEGGMQWRGFAEMEGDFGKTMQRAGISDLFSDGRMYALFSGEGEVLREQPWWQGLQGRLRLRVDDGQVLTGGTLSKFLSAISLADLPRLLFGQRKELQKEGLFFKRMQVEATLHDQLFSIKKLAMRSPAMDMAGHGEMNLESERIDLLMAVRPFQNLDAMLAKIPLVRDLVGGAAHSLMRKAYHMYGPVTDAKVEEITPQAAGLASPGLIESLIRLPQQWFDQEKQAPR